jgi:hypothetical protein
VDAHRFEQLKAVSFSALLWPGRFLLYSRGNRVLERRQKIVGTPYGTFGSRDNSGNDYNRAFDGDTGTFFDAVAPTAQYLGIELKSGNESSTRTAPVVVGNDLRHYHIGNSLTDGMDAYTRELALAAGFKDAWADRQTIPGAPLWINYQSDGGFGTNHKVAFVKFAPITDLVMQTFISNSDSEDPEFSLKFYDDARVKSPTFARGFTGSGMRRAATNRAPVRRSGKSATRL